MRSTTLKTIGKRVLQIGLPLLVVVFFVYQIRKWNWDALTSHSSQGFHWNSWLLVLAFLGFLLQELSYGLIWRAVLIRLGFRRDLRICLRIYLASEFVRYIPGNVWHVLARLLWISKYGVPRPIAFASMTIELITKLASAALLFAVSLLFWHDIGAVGSLLNGSIVIFVGVGTILALLIGLHPRILNGLLNVALRLLKRDAVVLTVSYRDILLVTLAWCASWCVAGGAFYLLLLALWPGTPLVALPICIGIYAIAWDIGFVSFITPSGLGFREGAIAALFALSLPVPAGLGAIMAILSRIVSTLAELICVGIAYLSGGRQVREIQLRHRELEQELRKSEEQATERTLSTELDAEKRVEEPEVSTNPPSTEVAPGVAVEEASAVNNLSVQKRRGGWQKTFAIWRSRLYLYPAPKPMPHTRAFWIASGLVAFLAVLFSTYFIIYLISGHQAFMSNAEDLGIMDQAIWNTLHGNLLHQTICNTISDTNCYSFAGISRFAIHFEPILFLTSLFYLIWANPNMLLIIQTLVVATGAFPAFWLARLRLRNEWAAVAIALLYLLYPAQQLAVVDDFHAVTFTASLLLFVLYFMYTRRTVLLFVFAILAMACKEELPVVLALYGLWSVIFQQRWRSGLGLMGLAIAWLLVGVFVVDTVSPIGHSLLASRYTYLGSGPLQIAKNILFHPTSILKDHVLEHDHLFYIRLLLTPAGYLPLLAPWVLVLAVPTLGLNLLSSSANMYSGLYQYNAEMVPVLIFATIEAIVLILWLVQWSIAKFANSKQQSMATENKAAVADSVECRFIEHAEEEPIVEREKVADSSTQGGTAGGRLEDLEVAVQRKKPEFSPTWTQPLLRWSHIGLLVVLLGFVLFSALRTDYNFHGSLPFSQGFQWPQTSVHTDLAQHFIDMIPEDASASAQSSLVPHISHRSSIYLFPYDDDQADYLFLDVTSEMYPFLETYDYVREVKRVLLSGNYGVVGAQDGYLLLKRGLPAPGISPNSLSSVAEYVLPDLPEDFCSFASVAPQEVIHPLQVMFTAPGTAGPGASMDLVGYNVTVPAPFSLGASYMQVTTYWQVTQPTLSDLQLQVLMTGQSGGEYIVTSDFPTAYWCPTNTWKSGTVLMLQSKFFKLPSYLPNGLAHVSIALIPVADVGKLVEQQRHDRFPLQVVKASGAVMPVQGANALQLATITLVP